MFPGSQRGDLAVEGSLSLCLSLCEQTTGVLFDTLHLEARLARWGQNTQLWVKAARDDDGMRTSPSKTKPLSVHGARLLPVRRWFESFYLEEATGCLQNRFIQMWEPSSSGVTLSSALSLLHLSPLLLLPSGEESSASLLQRSVSSLRLMFLWLRAPRKSYEQLIGKQRNFLWLGWRSAVVWVCAIGSAAVWCKSRRHKAHSDAV